jgi:hypothetical protein
MTVWQLGHFVHKPTGMLFFLRPFVTKSAGAWGIEAFPSLEDTHIPAPRRILARENQDSTKKPRET